MANEPLLSEPASDPEAPASENRASDVAMLLAAVDRMEAATRGDRQTVERLRGELAALGSALADAVTALQSGAIKPDAAADDKAIAALLQDVTARVGAMMEIVAWASADRAVALPALDAQAAAATEDVPTVSDVVSRLGRPEDAAIQAEPEPRSEGVLTPSMLGAMVKALSAEAPPGRPGDAATLPTEAPPRPETLPSAAAPRDTLLPDVDLMAGFARLEAMPILPAEVGTAVIFSLREDAPPALPPDAQGEVETTADTGPGVRSQVSGPNPATEPEPAAPDAPPTPETVDQDSDPTAFLFEPEADPDPADFLLGPIPPPSPIPAQQPAADHDREPPLSRQEPLRPSPRPPVMPEPPPLKRKVARLPPPAPADPLAGLKNLSEAEKLALFS